MAFTTLRIEYLRGWSLANVNTRVVLLASQEEIWVDHWIHSSFGLVPNGLIGYGPPPVSNVLPQKKIIHAEDAKIDSAQNCRGVHDDSS